MASRKAPLVMHVVHSLEGGGTERTLVSLLRSFDHRMFRHMVVTLRDAGSLAAQLPDEVACLALGIVGRSRTSGFRFVKACARLRPSIIHARNVCTWPDALVASMPLPRAKLVLGFHGLQSGGHFTRRDRCIARFASAFGARFASVSRYGRQQLVHDLGVPIHRIEHLPNGIDLGPFDIDASAKRIFLRDAFGYSSHDRVVGIVGSLTPVKGHDVLLSAIAKAAQSIPNIRLLIVGGGPLRKALEEKSKELGVHNRVQFTGWWDDVPALLSALDAYVCASRSEGMSNALMEAMAAGLPIVSTSVGDHPVILRHGVDGLVVPPDDTAALTESLQVLLGSPECAIGMGRSARSRIEEFSLARSVNAYQRFYGELAPQTAAQTLAIAHPCPGVSKSVIGSLLPRVGTGTTVE